MFLCIVVLVCSFQKAMSMKICPATERIPVEFTKSFLDKGHVLYTDNFCTSPMLASFLLQNQTFLFGTVKKNCKHCYKDISNVIFEKGTASFFQTSNVNNTMFSCKHRASKGKAGNRPKASNGTILQRTHERRGLCRSTTS